MTSLSRRLPRTARRRPGLLARLGALLSLRRQRARLAQLDDRALRDIGITRAEAEAEARRPAWQAPSHWRA
ncbi:MAG: DUF1127 domain-containing protein [Paracoccaceae bacterium]